MRKVLPVLSLAIQDWHLLDVSCQEITLNRYVVLLVFTLIKMNIRTLLVSRYLLNYFSGLSFFRVIIIIMYFREIILILEQ